MGTTVAFQWIDEKLWFSMDRSEARVRAIRRDPRVSLVLRTGGQSVTVKPDQRYYRVGDTVRIEGAAMGSYLLQKSSGSSSMRVKRIE